VRTEYLDQSEEPNYGERIQVNYVKENHSKGYFYSDELEGWTNIPGRDIKIGSIIEVIAVSHSTGEFEIV
jgi:hypothetical protein